MLKDLSTQLFTVGMVLMCSPIVSFFVLEPIVVYIVMLFGLPCVLLAIYLLGSQEQ